MDKFVLSVNNSFCRLSDNIPADIENLVKNILTYRNDIEAEKGQIFYQMKMTKKFGVKMKKGESQAQAQARARQKMGMLQKKLKDLEASEWVCWYQNRTFPTGHLNIVRDLLIGLKANFDVIDSRTRETGDHIFKWYNKPFAPRYYQEEMIDLGMEWGRGVFESAVGTGKTLIMTYLIKNVGLNSLIIVPSRGLKDQVYEELYKHFGRHTVQKIDSKEVRAGKELKPIRIATIQTLAALKKTDDLSNLLADVGALFVDEIHHAGAKSYTDILADIDHIYWRFGFTGTFLRNDNKSLDMWGFLSNKLYSYPAWKAIEDGYLTPIDVVTYDLKGKRSRSYPKEYDNCYCGSPEITNKVLNIIKEANPDDQILILVNKKDKAGKIFHETLNAHGIQNSYISGDDHETVITETIQAFNDKEVNILIGSSVIGEGIDVRSADHLILAQGGKSEIVIVQAIGRLVRLFEGKERGYVHDFNFHGTQYMQKHYKQRIDIIERNFQPNNWITE